MSNVKTIDGNIIESFKIQAAYNSPNQDCNNHPDRWPVFSPMRPVTATNSNGIAIPAGKFRKVFLPGS